MKSSSKRIVKELEEIKRVLPPGISAVIAEETNILCWKITLVPLEYPYDKGAFKIHVDFTAEYPFKPPKINFKTSIYHPNVDEKGQVCLPIIAPENWKPAVKMDQVLKALLDMINMPEPEHPLRADLADEFRTDKKKFNKKAESETLAHAEPRP